MGPLERLKKYTSDDNYALDDVLMEINVGKIKCGKYAHLVKINKDFKVGKELFKNGKNYSES